MQRQSESIFEIAGVFCARRAESITSVAANVVGGVMKSVGYYTRGDPETLVEIEVSMPQPGPRDLLVSVQAVSVNPIDVKRRRWEDPADGSTHRILGYDAAGVVAAVGSAVTLFKPGDEVFYAGAMDRPGTNAEMESLRGHCSKFTIPPSVLTSIACGGFRK